MPPGGNVARLPGRPPRQPPPVSKKDHTAYRNQPGRLGLCHGVQSGSSAPSRFSLPTSADERAVLFTCRCVLKGASCLALSIQFTEAFGKAVSSKPSLGGDLLESEILEMMEKVCHHSNFQNYGVKDVDGVRHLSGPGLPANEVPGVQAGGGRWPGRMSLLCEQLVGEIGDEEIFSTYKENPDKLATFLCRGEGLQGSCVDRKPKRRKLKSGEL
ncbi:PREDICTED: marginal zone B- and B1-cell-specific protein-like [Priapulus caudatus]|uniref:Marginal zone B- and B1-cell-specific protein-like n=1 Tax=Priapulus caudatus TaxID=37621 RepID=A0ABM1F2B3_PRICU|nr:PREDICTED: marginal zone B- and B1-cell-specific protein-like [Priapulus caudatus]